MTVCPSLAATFELLTHRRNVSSIDLVDVFQNWLNWFYFLFLDGGLLVILIDCIIFLSLFLDVTRMSMSTITLLAQLGCGILCHRMLSSDL